MNQAEQREINLLLGVEDFSISVSLFGIRKTFKNKPFTLGRQIRVSRYLVQMEVDEEAIDGESVRERLASQYEAVAKNGDRLAHAVAHYFSDSAFWRWTIRRYILRNWSSQELLEFVQKVIKAGDYGTFTASIVLMNGNRPTKATTIERG